MVFFPPLRSSLAARLRENSLKVKYVEIVSAWNCYCFLSFLRSLFPYIDSFHTCSHLVRSWNLKKYIQFEAFECVWTTILPESPPTCATKITFNCGNYIPSRELTYYPNWWKRKIIFQTLLKRAMLLPRTVNHSKSIRHNRFGTLAYRGWSFTPQTTTTVVLLQPTDSFWGRSRVNLATPRGHFSDSILFFGGAVFINIS